MTQPPSKAVIRRLAAVAFVAGALAVTILSLLPDNAMPHTRLWDKAQHVIAYLCLGLAGGIAFPDRRFVPVLGLGLVALGIGLEFGQAIIPGRYTSAWDALANTLGVMLGLALARFTLPRTGLSASS